MRQLQARRFTASPEFHARLPAVLCQPLPLLTYVQLTPALDSLPMRHCLSSALLLCTLSLASTAPKAAGDGDPDLSFGSNGFRLIDTPPIGDVPTNERGLFGNRLADGRLLVVMQAEQANAQRAIGWR